MSGKSSLILTVRVSEICVRRGLCENKLSVAREREQIDQFICISEELVRELAHLVLGRQTKRSPFLSLSRAAGNADEAFQLLKASVFTNSPMPPLEHSCSTEVRRSVPPPSTARRTRLGFSHPRWPTRTLSLES